MTIQEALAEQDIQKKVDNLKKGRLTSLPDISAIKKEWNPAEHKIFDTGDRPDKTVYYNQLLADGTFSDKTSSRLEKVARIALAFQKLIVKRAASFLFGNPVKVIADDKESVVAKAVDKILAQNKQKGFNKRVARNLFSSTEVAEYWYPVKADSKFSNYGFETDVKIKSMIFSPLKGDELYPFFDETGDMVAFSRQYKIKQNDREVLYFETWTSDQYLRYKQDENGWIDALDGKELKLTLGKIPIVYACQEAVEWYDVQWLIERLEKLISNFADTIDYNASPKHVVSGEVKGFSKKGESGAIIETEEGGDVKVLTWDQAPEGVKFEIENLLRLMFSLTQTPDISFEAVKGLGNAASGESLKMLFLDAHLKVEEKMEIFDDYLERRFNILKKYVGVINKSLAAEADKIELTPEVVPYMVHSDKDKIDNLVTAVAGGIMSVESATEKNPLVENGKEEFIKITAEKDAAAQAASELDNQQNQE